MKPFFQTLGWVALLLTVVPPALFMTHHLPEAAMKNLLLIGCLAWFVSAPVFMKGGSQ